MSRLFKSRLAVALFVMACLGAWAFWLAGVGDLWTGTPDIEGTLRQVDTDYPVILFTHNPDIFPNVPARVSLTVAGHTHGGQVNLPLLGRPVVPSDFGQRYAYGHVVEGGRHLFVGGGVGTSIIPARFRVPPEIVILTLH
jgi:predicted MPP superfamily phosphohydrolase